MGLRMKNFNIVELKKPIYWGDCLRGVAWTVCRFKRGLGKKEGVVFLRGVDTPVYTMRKHLLYVLRSSQVNPIFIFFQ